MQPFDRHPVIPILIVENPEEAVRAVGAIVEGGLDVIEITLRKANALAVLEACVKAFPHAVIGAGMVQRPSEVTAAKSAGARFLTSPGLTAGLAAAGIASGLPFMPGAATASEVMVARDMSFPFLKFFPAFEAGGVPLLRSFAAAFAGIEFCPAGGIDEEMAAEYLAQPNVPVVGATWIAKAEAIDQGDWRGITDRARRAVAFKRVA
ncbi:MAG TPA: bifunctional 4-hydroxy-2-oxoglutarate aldolase/2-dehydro-3-deoxy-phosphogluconate aldolase [Stellaceae bacterium]|jgi:2-dehydro-3-deoxyphosphogluconate aldolase/(4S)-4-hydroxy-2-oxoglutarate aldolase|nr:bifunctional 4-hydroxy-2-oxoglutarate aldolase/2-dehydro-3-deoxy-phosphogluconate aldolase [Stellaceae bacterium]